MNFGKYRSGSSSSLLSSTKSTKSNSSKDKDCGISEGELDRIDRDLASLRYLNALEKHAEIKKQEAELKDELEKAKAEQAELDARKTELVRRKKELAKMFILRESIKLGHEIKEFTKTVITPIIGTTRIPLNLNESEFARLKDTLDAIKASIDDPSGRSLIEKVLEEIDKQQLEDHFVSSMADEQKLISGSKALVNNIEESATIIINLKAEIDKFQDLLDKCNIEEKEKMPKESNAPN